jgi:hypothetical protein
VVAVGCGDGQEPSSDQDRESAARILLSRDDVPDFIRFPRGSGWIPVYTKCGRDGALLPGRGSRFPKPTSFIRDATTMQKLEVDAVESHAVLAKTQADAEHTMDVLSDPAFRRCVQKGLEIAQEETVEGKEVVGSSIVELETPVAVDEMVAFRVAVNEESFHIDHELTVIRKGRALAFLFTGRFGPASYPDSARQRLVSIMAARMP